MAFCTNCGQEVPEGTRFCSNCGAPIGEQNNREIDSGINDAMPHTEPDNGFDKHDKKANNSKKGTSAIWGIISFIMAIIGLALKYPVCVGIAIASIVLAIISLVKKGGLKGFAIAAIILSVVGIISAISISGDKQSTDKKESSANTAQQSVSEKEEAEAENNSSDKETAEEEGTEYSVGGITFILPVEYKLDSDSGEYRNNDNTIAIYFESSDLDCSDEQFADKADKFDEVADSIGEYFTDAVRKKALESTVAGFNSRSYIYAGQYNGYDALANIEIINDTKKDKLVIVMMLGLQSEEDTLNRDYESILKSAEYTGASDTVVKETEAKKESGDNKKTGSTNVPEGVDPDLAAFLTEYEQFMDKYVAFMEKYKKNPTDLSLLGEYSEMLQEYSDFSAKADAYDSSSMSTADAAYYLEVTSRVSQKMLKVLGAE